MHEGARLIREHASIIQAEAGVSEGRESRSRLVSRLKVPRLSVSSQSRTKFWNLSRLVSDVNFWDSLVPVSSRWFNFYLVSSRSRPDLDE